jgi:hypothetical protein
VAAGAWRSWRSCITSWSVRVRAGGGMCCCDGGGAAGAAVFCWSSIVVGLGVGGCMCVVWGGVWCG